MPNHSLKHRPNRPHYDTYKQKALALKKQTKLYNLPCWLCHQPIDTNLHWKHPQSFTADHTTPLANGGKPNGELRPAHRSCNSRKSNRPYQPTSTPPSKNSTHW